MTGMNIRISTYVNGFNSIQADQSLSIRPRLTTLVSREFDRSFHPENFISSSLVRSTGSRAPPFLVA